MTDIARQVGLVIAMQGAITPLGRFATAEEAAAAAWLCSAAASFVTGIALVGRRWAAGMKLLVNRAATTVTGCATAA
jgi:NAD(P)-dependent dehydrogenase (short-subunit alcohol dehydrogenase family)